MAIHAIRRVSDEGIGYSVVELNDVCHIFAAAIPRSGATLGQQTEDALRTIAAATKAEGSGGSIVHQAVFIADGKQIGECRNIVRSFYGGELPATSYIPQPPCQGKLVAIEAFGVGQGRGEVHIERPSEQVVIARHNGIGWIHCAQIVPQAADTEVYAAATSAFEQMGSILSAAGARLGQVIRTWLYLGGIVDAEGAGQRYCELNRARGDFYRNVSFLAGRLPPGRNGRVYPASTGIGTAGRQLMVSAIALDTARDDILAVPLENPRQMPAYDYSSAHGDQSPRFSRAVALSCGVYATIFISGTASITNSQTRHVGNVAAQTHETLDNIAALITEDNLARHGLPGLGTSLAGLGLLRVYIKRQADYEAVKAICRQRLGELPTIYAVADICRPELLVEIEGIGFSKKGDITDIGASRHQ